MDFRVSEAQQELAEGIRTMLAGRLPLERIRAHEGDEHVISADDWEIGRASCRERVCAIV